MAAAVERYSLTHEGRSWKIYDRWALKTLVEISDDYFNAAFAAETLYKNLAWMPYDAFKETTNAGG